MKILAFGASYSKTSINKAFAAYVAGLFTEDTIHVIDLNHFQLPVFTVDLEQEIGHPAIISEFIDHLNWADFLVVSMAENNGAYSAAFKNLFDWTSRVKGKMFEGKKMLLLATSDGARGAQSVLSIAMDRFPRHGAEILASFSLPKFYENFDPQKGILEANLHSELLALVGELKKSLKNYTPD